MILKKCIFLVFFLQAIIYCELSFLVNNLSISFPDRNSGASGKPDRMEKSKV